MRRSVRIVLLAAIALAAWLVLRPAGSRPGETALDLSAYTDSSRDGVAVADVVRPAPQPPARRPNFR